jgi:hypothetical protein
VRAVVVLEAMKMDRHFCKQLQEQSNFNNRTETGQFGDVGFLIVANKVWKSPLSFVHDEECRWLSCDCPSIQNNQG